ncbi:MAG: LysR family substrate-binding domain-containing protein [Roseitalea sp.]|nr:LysR family substrate-binding domain-containing protein [Roseitalea sp.]MBO6722660.1 LysR family substrate-binding domain-containing protein [Roseitalea sp.]MBO6741556.1 LysR family substrate-binding domain-containing protein [Roseitalea sp.]
MRGREFDAVFLIGVEAMQDFDSVPLWTERVHVALPEDHILAKPDALTRQHIRYEPFVVRRWASGSMIWHRLADRMIADGIEPSRTTCRIARRSLLGLVAIGRGLTVVSDAATSMTIPGVVYRPVDDPDATITVRLAWMPENDNPALPRFVSFAKSFVQDPAAAASPST